MSVAAVTTTTSPEYPCRRRAPFDARPSTHRPRKPHDRLPLQTTRSRRSRAGPRADLIWLCVRGGGRRRRAPRRRVRVARSHRPVRQFGSENSRMPRSSPSSAHRDGLHNDLPCRLAPSCLGRVRARAARTPGRPRSEEACLSRPRSRPRPNRDQLAAPRSRILRRGALGHSYECRTVAFSDRGSSSCCWSRAWSARMSSSSGLRVGSLRLSSRAAAPSQARSSRSSQALCSATTRTFPHARPG